MKIAKYQKQFYCNLRTVILVIDEKLLCFKNVTFVYQQADQKIEYLQ